MSDAPLVLSLFPGLGLLDRAFELEGFCVVRGPDVIWGGDVRTFHAPRGAFDGIIGGPPCQQFSALRKMNPHVGRHGDLIPEFERCVGEIGPAWFLMENVRGARLPGVAGYTVAAELLNNRWFGAEQHRIRRFSFGTRDGRSLRPFIQAAPLMAATFEYAVLSGHGGPVGRVQRRMLSRTPEEMARLQGLPLEMVKALPFTTRAKREAIGNGVPLPMGRAVARAVRLALERQARAS